jgi:hypothetical protein
MLRSRRESHHRNGITDLNPPQLTSATKSARLRRAGGIGPFGAKRKTFTRSELRAHNSQCAERASWRPCRRADANACQSISPTIFVISAAEKARSVSVRTLPSAPRLKFSDMADDSSGASTIVGDAIYCDARYTRTTGSLSNFFQCPPPQSLHRK